MKLSFGIFDVVVISGMIQGVVYGFMILFMPGRPALKFLTAALLSVMVFLSFKILIHTLGLWERPYFRYFPLAIDTLFQPLIYLYALELTGDAVKRGRGLHFILPLVFLIHGLCVYLFTVAESDGGKQAAIARLMWYDQFKWLEDVMAILSGFFYWIISFRHIRRYRRWLFATQSASQYPELAWMRNLLLGSGIFVIVLTVASVPFGYTQFFYVYLAILIYFFAINGKSQILLRAWVPAKAPAEELPDEVRSDDPAIPWEEIRAAVLFQLEEKRVFLDPELNLKQVALLTGYPLAQVSVVINGYFKVNFRNLINRYRVEEVKQRLNDPAYRHLSLLGIALECGFNSEASFYRIFRKTDGNSPGDYLRTLRRKQ